MKMPNYLFSSFQDLSNEELLACFKMLEGGADPTALALLVRQIKSDAAALKAGSNQSAHPQEIVSNENQPSL